MKSYLYFIALLIFVTSACKKADEEEPINPDINKIFLNSEIRIYDIDPAVPRTHQHLYDTRGRLVQSHGYITFRYKEDGKLDWIKQNDDIVECYYDASDKLVRVAYFYSFYQVEYSYNFNYNNQGQISRVTRDSSDMVYNYTYNGNGNVENVTINYTDWEGNAVQLNNHFVWDNNNLLSVSSGNDVIKYEYDQKINYNKAMHYPKEYYQLSMCFSTFADHESILSDVFYLDMAQLADNNVVSERFYTNDSLEREYIINIVEYTNEGLPKKLLDYYGSLEFIYTIEGKK